MALENIEKIAKKVGINADDLELYGKYKAKIHPDVFEKVKDNKDGKLVLVTAITPTKAGEGKTTTSIALLDGLAKLKQKALNDMELAYAQTCHSCQGSQYKKVLGILDMSHYMLLNNEMIYTLMTRAEENCWLLMQPQAFVKCLRTHANRRNTFMSKMLTKQI